MRTKNQVIVTLSFACLLCFSFIFQSQVNKFSVTKTEQALFSKGQKKIKTTSEVLFKSNGEVVTHMTHPSDKYVVSDRFGNMSIYLPEANTATQQTDVNLSTINSIYYHFCQGRYDDLGLRSMGFELEKTRTLQGHLITIWDAPSTMWKVLRKARLVHKKGLPIYLSFINKDGQEFDKTYYSNYINAEGMFKFPADITQISILEAGKDSIITRTHYSNIKINQSVNPKLLNFSIPADAKVFKRQK